MDQKKILEILKNNESMNEDYLIGAINKGHEGRKLLRMICRVLGSQSAASPWTYRTDTGDEHGKVVESAELPEKDSKKVFIGKFKGMIYKYEIILWGKYGGMYLVCGAGRDFNWLRKHLIAYAEIRR